ncbi:unnamed protein product [Cyclocybe aegerita]|uniref:Uncharacterized protein n=1 Tax=Cyclocybe aegerita TaxID=1973307 RepID=A0A8S0XN27_CYCAE|nr:unnamed protein product [Cyclocybe aegerita]
MKFNLNIVDIPVFLCWLQQIIQMDGLTDEVNDSGFLLWVENSRGNRYPVERTEGDAESGGLNIYLGVRITWAPDICFHLFWQPTEDQADLWLCKVAVSPPSANNQGTRYCSMRGPANVAYSTQAASYSRLKWMILRAMKPHNPPPGTTYLATATLEIFRVKDNLPPKVLTIFDSLNNDPCTILPEIEDENDIFSYVQDTPCKTFKFQFHRQVFATQAGAYCEKRKHSRSGTVIDLDSDDAYHTDSDDSMTVLALRPRRKAQERALAAPNPRANPSRGQEARQSTARRKTALRHDSEPSIITRTIQRLQKVTQEGVALKKEIEKRVQEQEAANEAMRQALAKFKA